MTPIAFFPGAGADSIQPIGKTFVGGLTVSSLMTLFVIPIMYSVLNSRRDKKRLKDPLAVLPASVIKSDPAINIAAMPLPKES
jgi:hypothetical protein